MALNLVTFEDKQNLNTKPEIARINKVIDDDINQLKKALNELIFPVGSIIYNASEEFDPNAIYGGTWEKIEGKMIIGYDADDSDFDTLKATGGSKTHTQTVSEMPNHSHSAGANIWAQKSGYGQIGTTSTGGANRANIASLSSAGDGQPMNIMNPYFVANIWHRIA